MQPHRCQSAGPAGIYGLNAIYRLTDKQHTLGMLAVMCGPSLRMHGSALT